MKKEQSSAVLLVGVIGFLLLSGMVFVFDASYAESYALFGNQYHFVRNQIVWVGLGLIAGIVGAILPRDLLKKLAIPAGIVSLVLLALVLIPGIGREVNGARRWIVIGSYTFQPTDAAKIAISLYGAYSLTTKQNLRRFFVGLGIVGFFVLLQPDMDTAVVLGLMSMAMLFVAGVSWRIIGSIVVAGALVIPLLILSSPYRRARLLTYFDSNTDPNGSSYHIRQIQLALGSGGFFGQGFGQSRAKYQFIPEASTDSIFAIVAEEVGFVGSSLMMIGLLSVVLLGFWIAVNSTDEFDRLLATGISSWFGAQIGMNLGSMTALIPLSGITLPFISYGGSSMITVLCASGILVGITARKNNEGSR